MEKEYLDRIKIENPWFFDVNSEMNLIITDDIDSIMSSLLLMQYRPNWHINYYYGFDEGLYHELGCDQSIDKIGVDLSATTMKCISNHVTALREDDYINPNDINLNYVNNHVGLRNYHSKYNLNTFCLVYSLLNLHPKSKRESAMLLMPDSAFQAHYANPNYKDSFVQRKYLNEIMELPELYKLMENNDISKFYRFQEQLRIKSKFYVSDEGIRSVENIDLEYLCDVFEINNDLLKELEGLFVLKQRVKSYIDLSFKKYEKSNSEFVSFAVTSKNYVNFSKKVAI